MNDFVKFIGKVAATKKIKGLTSADLARMTGYSRRTIDMFLSNAPRPRSPKVARALSEALQIKL